MLPLLPYALGLATGVIAVRLLRSDQAKAGLERAQASLGEATATGLAAIERASARAREHLSATGAAPAAAAGEAAPAARARKTAPAKKAAARSTSKVPKAAKSPDA